jgi:DNA-binding winged helix-turn-helix (wHTH) protein/tetratricopeptide (TPR) repeat protein
LYEFGPFRVDEKRGVLLRDNQPVPLTAKCLETLIVLIERREQTVSKDVLMKTVWPDTFVEESNLTQHVSLLRKALGERPQDRRYIATVAGEGYKFVAPVTVTRNGGSVPEEAPSSGNVRSSTTAPRSRPKTLLLLALAVILATAASLWLVHLRNERKLGPKDSVLLTDFENSTGEPVFDGALKEGMSVELGQSPFLEMISADRVQETLRFMGRNPEERVVYPLAPELCERAGGRALVSGSISRLGSGYVLAVEAMSCADEVSIAREQVEVASRENVLPALEAVASKLRNKLGESLSSIQRFDKPIEQATTPSLEALKAYSLGLEHRTQGAEKEAIPLFQHAVELDPKFAMAYAQLGAVYNNLGETDRATEYLKRAYGLRTNLSEREKLFLTARYQTVVTGETDQAIETYQVWGQMFPRDWIPFNSLSARYQVIGQYEKAVDAATEALKLQPNHYSPYANLALSYLSLNRFDDAVRVAKDAEAAKRDSLYSHRVLFEIAFLKHDQPAMQRELDWAKNNDRENDLLIAQAFAFMSAGKVRAARQLFERSWAASERNGLNDDAAYAMALESLAEADFGNFREARTRAAAALRLGKGIDARETAAEALAVAGDIRQARTIADQLHARYPQHQPLNAASLTTIAASIELQQKRPANAIRILENAAPYDLSEFSNLSPIYIRGKAHLEAHHGEDAAATFQKILDHSGIDVTSQRHPLAQLGLARAYAETGDTQRALQAYEAFFALWSEADPDIPVLRSAKLEYGRLH